MRDALALARDFIKELLLGENARHEEWVSRYLARMIEADRAALTAEYERKWQAFNQNAQDELQLISAALGSVQRRLGPPSIDDIRAVVKHKL